MQYSYTPAIYEVNTIIGDPENGCILPPSEYKKLLEDPILLCSLEQYIGASKEKIIEALSIRSTQYYKPRETIHYHGYAQFKIEKKDKKVREGSKPHRHLKEIQELLQRQLLHIPISPHITSGNRFQKGDGVSNAKKHMNNPYTITLDVKKAYTGINTHRVFKNIEGALFRNLGILAPLLSTNEQKQRFIRAITHLIVWNNQLPEGAPTSPAVFDIVASKLDAELVQKTAAFPINNQLMTRYRDDITLSFQSHRGTVLQCIESLRALWNIPLAKEKQISQEKGAGNKQLDTMIYKFIKQMNPDAQLTGNILTSNDFKNVLDNLHNKSKNPSQQEIMTNENLGRYLDIVLEKTEEAIFSLYQNVAITNEVDQKSILGDIQLLISHLQTYIEYFDSEYTLHDRHRLKMQGIIDYLSTTPFSYPAQTIGDIAHDMCKILQQQGYKVNMKKLRTQTPGAAFPIEITGVAKMPDGSLMLPKFLMTQYCKVLTDFAKLSYSNLKNHPFYKTVFFHKSDFSDQKEYIFKYVNGIMNYIKRIYSVQENDLLSKKLPKKLYEDYQDFIRRWGRVSKEQELEMFTDPEYNNAYMYGNKNNKIQSDNISSPSKPQDDGESIVPEDLPF